MLRYNDIMKKLEVVLPVYNEAHDVPAHVPVVHAFLKEHCAAYDWHLLIAEQASTDGTLDIAQKLAQSLDRISVTHRAEKGRGGALKAAWLASDADILAYMDIDLSSDINAFSKLLEALEKGADLAVGSRLSRGSIVENRSQGREVASRMYSMYLKFFLGVHFDDAQCGFKLVRKDAFRALAPQLTSAGWIFDTELLVIAEKVGMRIASIPIRWRDDLETRVILWRYALEGLRGGLRLRFTRPWRKIVYH